MEIIGKIFNTIENLKGNFIIDNPYNPKKRKIFLLLEKDYYFNYFIEKFKKKNLKMKKLNRKTISLVIILGILMTSFYTLNLLTNISNSSSSSSKKSDNTIDYISPDADNPPELSTVYYTSWWNSSFQYRRILNITNPEPTKEFIDQGVNITINENYFTDPHHVDFKDIRIVENSILRNYYYKEDYPSNNLVTIWFETNISIGQYDTDTFLYYGNDSVDVDVVHSNFIEERFGIHWYPLDEGQSTTAYDMSGAATGTLELGNEPTWITPGHIGAANVEFDGSNERINSNPGQSITTGELSISFWFNLDSQGSNTALRKSTAAYLLEFGAGEGNGMGSSPQLYVSVPGGNHYVWGDAVLYDTWYHIVGTYEDNDMRLYLNGEPISVTVRGGSIGGAVQDSSGLLVLGGYGGERFLGQMDDVRIMDYALPLEEVKWIYSFNTTIDVFVDEEQPQFAVIEVHAIDLKGNYIPGANISLYNHSAQVPLINSKITDDEGGVTFVNIPLGPYNFTVKIYSNATSGLFATVNRTTNQILIDSINQIINLTCNVSTHIFSVLDADGDPVDSGWISVGNGTDSLTIQKCTINAGNAVFRWVNTTPNYYYNYTVYYQDSDYNPTIIALAENISIDVPHNPIQVQTNLTTIYFRVNDRSGPPIPISGAKIILRQNNLAGLSIVNLTTDINGQATLRWVNSSGLIPGQIINYSVQINFAGLKPFNNTIGGPSVHIEFNFNVSYRISLDLRISITPEDYQTDLIPIYPIEDEVDVKWGTQLLMRYIFNVTSIGSGDNANLLGYKYADSMSYTVIGGFSGTLPKEIGKEGYHSGTIDTTQLTGGKSYTIQINAQKSGYTPPSSLAFTLTISQIEVQLNQSQNDDSTQTVYWQEDVTMSVKPYGHSSENFILENSVYKDTQNNVYNCTIFVPELSTDWNISQVVFNLYNVTHDREEKYIYVTIEDPFGVKKTWNGLVDTGNYYFKSAAATNGSWTDLVVPLNNKESLTHNNTFEFKIYGNFTGTVDVVAESTFIRDKINVEYLLHNITDSISFYSYGEGWSIQNITFEISNCYDASTWTIVNPKSVIDNLTTNEGLVDTDITGDALGNGRIEINNTIIYPRDNQFLFLFGNNTNIVFDAVIKVEYIQGFYKTNYLEIYNVSLMSPGFKNNSAIMISPEGSSWFDNGVLLSIRRILNETADLKSPSEIVMTITLDGIDYYDIIDFFPGEGYIRLDTLLGFSKNIKINVSIKTNVPVDFEISFKVSNFRTFTYEIKGDITYEIKPTNPPVTGLVPYNADLEYYVTTIDTTAVDADSYIVVFSYTDPINRYGTDSKDLNLIVEERVTLLNGNTRKLTNIVSDIFVKDAVNFTFTYLDRDLATPVANLDLLIWTWWSGDIKEESGDLELNAQNQYVFDFDTEARAVGTYSITIELDKSNYNSKIVSITLIVNLRTFESELGDTFEDKQVNVVKGKKVTLQIELTDPTKGGAPLTGATVILEIGDDELEFDEVEAGVYELEFDTDDYEAFYTSNTLTGTIKISKINYISDEIDITIVIEMEETIEGMPTFYLIMIIGAIAAVVGSLATYKFIQIARIPKFVKKARAMKKAIKRKSAIPESSTTSTKSSFILKQFRDEWDALDLSLEEILGLKSKKDKQYDIEGGMK